MATAAVPPPTLIERIVASDPGSVRLALASRAAVALVAVLVAGDLLAGAVGLTGTPRTVVLVLGSVLTMMTIFTASAPTTGERLLTQLSLPFVMVAGIVLAMAVDAHRLVSFVTFVAVMFAAVWVRRFGPRLFAMGMVGWIGYFITLFLKLSFTALPAVLLGLAGATVVLLVLSAVLPMRPALRLRRMAGSFRARVRIARHVHARRVAGGSGAGDARVGRTLLRVDETAVLVDGQSAVPGALPGPGEAVALRAAVLRVELALAALLEAPAADDATGDDATEDDATEDDTTDEGDADAALDRALARFDTVLAGTDRAPGGAGTGDFTPAAELFGGFLPSSVLTVASISDGAVLRTDRLLPATRQALQIAVAGALCIGLGDLVSGQRWYWAVLACFLSFTGTATAGETVRKAVQRTLGTVVGVAVALVVVPLLGASVPVVLAVVLVALFVGFYLFRVSYTSLALCVTVIVAELYQLLGSFSGGLLTLRIGETALGAVIGGVVALVVLPLRARSAEAAAHARLAEALQHAIDGVVDVLHERATGADPAASPGEVDDLHARTRAVDAAVHQLALVGVPLAVRSPGRADARAAVARRLENWVGAAVRVRAVVHAIADGAHGGGAGGAGGGGGAADPIGVADTARRVRGLAVALAVGDLPGRSGLRAPGEDRGLLGRELAALHGVLVALHEIDPRVTVPDDVPAPGGVTCLRGTVTDAAGRALGAAVVTVVDGSGRECGRTRSGRTGSYEVAVGGPGTYQVVVGAPDHAPRADRVVVAAWDATEHRHDVALGARTGALTATPVGYGGLARSPQDVT